MIKISFDPAWWTLLSNDEGSWKGSKGHGNGMFGFNSVKERFSLRH